MSPAQRLFPSTGRHAAGGEMKLTAIERDCRQQGQKTDEFGIIDNGDCRVEFTR